MPAQVTMTLKGTERVLAVLNGLSREMVDTKMLRGIGLLAVRSVQRGIREQKSPDGTPYPAVGRFGQGGKRMLDTARLLNSITFEVIGHGVIVGTNVTYAPAQNFGGTWGPKKAQKMAVPLTRQVARAFVSGKSLRLQYPDAFVLKARTGNLFLARRLGAGDRAIGLPLNIVASKTLGGAFNSYKRSRAKAAVELLYMLVDSTTIKGTHFLDRLSDTGERAIFVYVEASIQRRLGAAGAGAGGAEV